MDAAELLNMLEVMLEQNIPLHKLTVRIEVSDSHYDSDIERGDISIVTYRERNGIDERFLVFRGER